MSLLSYADVQEMGRSTIRIRSGLRKILVSLEETFSVLEAELLELDRDAAALRKAVSSARKAANHGSISEIGKAIEQGQARAVAVQERLASAAEHLGIDHVDYLASEAYVDELKEA